VISFSAKPERTWREIVLLDKVCKMRTIRQDHLVTNLNTWSPGTISKTSTNKDAQTQEEGDIEN